MGKVRWTHEAVGWLREIHDYIARDNPGAAQRTVQGIYERARALADFPEVGYRYRRRANAHIRILLHGQYRIAYLLKERGDVDILGIFHGAMNMERYLRQGDGSGKG